jgi:hypothetical protein
MIPCKQWKSRYLSTSRAGGFVLKKSANLCIKMYSLTELSGTRLLIIAFHYSRQELLNWIPAPNWCDIQLQLLQWKTVLIWTPAPNWCDIQLQLLQRKTGRTALHKFFKYDCML